MKQDDWTKLLFGLSPEKGTGSFASMYGLPAPPSEVPTLGSGLMPTLSGITPSPIPTMGSLADLRQLTPPPALTAIRFRTVAGQLVDFSEPKLLGGWLPTRSGLYAILIFDTCCNPRPYRVLYFGQAEKLSERVGWRTKSYPSGEGQREPA